MTFPTEWENAKNGNQTTNQKWLSLSIASCIKPNIFRHHGDPNWPPQKKMSSPQTGNPGILGKWSCMLCLATPLANKSIFHESQSNQTWTSKKQEIEGFFTLFVLSLICSMIFTHGSKKYFLTNNQKLDQFDHLGRVALPNRHRWSSLIIISHHF